MASHWCGEAFNDEKPTNEMVRRLIHARERVIEMAAFKKEDHRRADKFGWH
jgi:hypothetical protein